MSDATIKTRGQLSHNQQRAVEFIKTNPCCALWADMGTGKTVATLTALVDLYDQFEIGRVLVIAPLRVIQNTWPDEIADWAHTRGLTYTIVRGTPDERRRLTQQPTDIHLINREMVADLAAMLGKHWPYDTVVIDEASSFKSSKSQRFKSLRSVLPKISRIVELTGTPAGNGLLDLWPQIYLLDRGQRLGRTFTQYRTRYFDSDYMGYKWTPRQGAEDAIHAALSDIVLRLEYPHSTHPVYNMVRVQLPDAARLQYNELARECLLQIEQDTVEAQNAAVLSGKLLQCANGAIYTDDTGSADKTRAFARLHDAKLDALAEIIAETSSPVLVAYNFQHDLQRLRERFPHAETLDAPDAVRRWNAGQIPLLLAHPASAGHGLNLQHGGHVVVWFGLNWSLELYEQFNARLHRQGQTRQVIVHHIVARDTVDDAVVRALQGKQTIQRALLDALKHSLKQSEKIA